MPRQAYQAFTFGARQGTLDLLDMDSDVSSLTDEYDSGTDDSLDFGSVKFEGEENEAQDDGVANEDSEDNEWDDEEFPPLDINHEALKHVASQYLPGNHGKCVKIIALPRGSYHELRLLGFEDGWSCIASFARDREEPLAVLESAVATAEYVLKHTTIPVPKTYFVNPNPNHVVGAAFVLMERIESVHLYKIWDELSLGHKKNVLEQIADVVLQLATLEFDGIGSLRIEGSLGPLNDCLAVLKPDRPFISTIQYLLYDDPDPLTVTDEMRAINNDFTEKILHAYDKHQDTAALSAPYRLIHTDFDAQNMLFAHADPNEPPKLVGIIDWDNAHSSLLYELMEYPIFIQDVDWSPEEFATNKILRKHFARCLIGGYPRGSKERADVRECFRIKDWALSNFRDVWARGEDGEDGVRRGMAELKRVREGRAYPYDGTAEWAPDSEIESEDDEFG